VGPRADLRESNLDSRPRLSKDPFLKNYMMKVKKGILFTKIFKFSASFVTEYKKYLRVYSG
jgi:hypothetical protein